MQLFKKPTTSPVLGLDISSSVVKLLELSKKGSSYRVESYAIEAIAPGAVVDKAIADPGAVGESLKRAIKRSRTRAKYGAIAVGGSTVITKIISMPDSLSDDEMASQIELDAEQYIPYPLEEVHLDFHVVNSPGKNNGTVEVLLAASRSETVEARVAALEMGGLTAKVVDVEAYATETALRLLTPKLPGAGANQIVAVVDIGDARTSMSVLDNFKIIYTREQIFGGKQLTEEIQHRYDLSYEEAEKSKRRGTLPDDYAAELLEPFKEAMAQQISRSLQFFFSSSQYTHVDHIFLAGGNALIPGIAKLVQSKIGTPTTIANPFVGMTVASRVNAQALISEAPALMVACGLALRSFD